VFSLGTLPDDAKGRLRAQTLAADLAAALGGKRIPYGEAGARLGVNPNRLRYAAATGTVAIRWEGARQPTVWTLPAPALTPQQARLELARRYLHVYGPATAAAFGVWSGIGPHPAQAAFEALNAELIPASTPIGPSTARSPGPGAARAQP
jgi:Winged helix DNA-binding domain